MTWKKLKRQIIYYAQYFPFTLNLLICGLAAFIGYKILYTDPSKTDPEPFRPFIMLMGKLVMGFTAAIILASIFSTIFSWLYFIWLKKRSGNQLSLEFINKSKNGKSYKLFMNAELEGAKRPFLGFVKGRLFYDNHEMTSKFSLLSNKWRKKKLLPYAISGKSRLELPDIKEYQLKGGFIYFHDMLHLFSLAVKQPVKGEFYQPPVLKKKDEKDVSPKKTENTDIRIDQLRRVDGEYLNYKDFESGDDVRRIVWKVYAKNRELVVRIPEHFEPFASHLYFYASFHADVNIGWQNNGYLKEMLNYYKNNIWTVYDTLNTKEWQVRYIPDQSFSIPEHLTDNEKSARIISNSSWHKDKELTKYFDTKQGTVLCISSLTDVEELENILDEVNESTVIYFIKLSRTFKHWVAWGWFKRLIFQPPKDRLNKLRTRWVFAPLKFKIQKREKKIVEVLKSSQVTWTTI